MHRGKDEAHQRHDHEHDAEDADEPAAALATEIEEAHCSDEEEERVSQRDAAAQDVLEDVFDDARGHRGNSPERTRRHSPG